MCAIFWESAKLENPIWAPPSYHFIAVQNFAVLSFLLETLLIGQQSSWHFARQANISLAHNKFSSLKVLIRRNYIRVWVEKVEGPTLEQSNCKINASAWRTSHTLWFRAFNIVDATTGRARGFRWVGAGEGGGRSLVYAHMPVHLKLPKAVKYLHLCEYLPLDAGSLAWKRHPCMAAINTNADSGSHFVPQHFDSSSASPAPGFPNPPTPPTPPACTRVHISRWYCLQLCLKLILAAQKSYPSDVGNVRALIKCDIRILFAMFAGVIFCNYHHQQEVLNEALSKSDSLQFIFFFCNNPIFLLRVQLPFKLKCIFNINWNLNVFFCRQNEWNNIYTKT